MKKIPLSVLVLGTLCAVGLGGCATTPAKVDQGEYEWVTPLGSNVPVRVPKGQSAQTASPTGTMNADQATQAIRGAGTPAPKGGS